MNPLIFAIICYEVSAILSGLLGLLGVFGGRGFGSFLVSLIVAPIFAAIGLFIGAGILHLLVMLIVRLAQLWLRYVQGRRLLFRNQPRKLDTHYRVDSQPVRYLAIMGIREIHNTTTGKAALVVLIPAVVLFLLALLIIAAVGAALFFGTQQ